MEFEVLLNVNLSRQLLWVIGVLRLLDQVQRLCGKLRVQGDTGGTCGLQEVFDIHCWPHSRRERGLCWRICWTCRVGQGRNGSRGFWKCHSWRGSVTSQPQFILSSPVCGCIYLRTALVHLYSPCCLKATKSNIWWRWRSEEDTSEITHTLPTIVITFNTPKYGGRDLSIHYHKEEQLVKENQQDISALNNGILQRTIRILKWVHRLDWQVFIRCSICECTCEDKWRGLWVICYICVLTMLSASR